MSFLPIRNAFIPAYALAFSAGLLLTACISSGDDPAEFRYRESSGDCRNGAGVVGRNPYDSAAIHLSKRAECVDLSGVDLILLEKRELSFGWDSLKTWDFRGASFAGADIHFNHIIDADLRGADLSGIDYGYSVITGRRDAFTRLPQDGCAESTPDRVACWK